MALYLKSALCNWLIIIFDSRQAQPSRDLIALVPHLVMSAVFALAVFNGAPTFIGAASKMGMTSDEGLFISLVAFQLSAMYFPNVLRK